MAQVLDPVDHARDAATRLAWREAYEAFSALDRARLTPDDLERYADAAWWRGHLDEAIALRELAFAGFAKSGEKLRAARLALTLSWDHSGRGAFAVSQGWFANAERLLEGEPESTAHGVVMLMRAIEGLFGGRLDDAVESFGSAEEIARRFGDRDTEVLAIVGRGRAMVKRGEVEEGLALMDQGSACAVVGEISPYTSGLVYCLTISACQDVGDYRRAAEWTDVANKWCDKLDVSGFPGACRIHRAEIMRLRGDLAGAERQAIEACEELHDFERSITAGGYYEVGEIRRRLGDFEAAEEAFRRADELGRDPQPGLSLLRLAQGKVEAASASIVRSLRETEDPLARLRRLPARAEIAIAARDMAAARDAYDELEQLVDAYKLGGRRAPAFDATLHEISGRIALADGNAESAERCFRRAREEWQEVGAPYETARSRTLVASALRRQGDVHAAADELEAALATFERLGAQLDVTRINESLGRVEARRTFVFTDIVDSTKLLETLGDAKWKKLLARHDELVRECIAEGGGDLVKHTGDGVFAAFDSPRAAVDAAIAIQRALDGEIVAPDVRIGVHAGDAFHTDDSHTDYGGQGVHVAARIGAAAGAGEILVSRDTLADSAGAFRLGNGRSQELAGLDRPVDVVSVDWR
jgi:class 3 adenylate cyclase